MLDCEPPETDDPSEAESGGVSTPDDAEVQVLDRLRPTGEGRLKIEFSRTAFVAGQPDTKGPNRRNGSREARSSSPCAMSALSSRLWRSRRPWRALIIRSPPNWNDDVDAIDGCAARRGSLGDSLVGGFISNCRTRPGRAVAACRFSTRTHGEASTRELTERRRT